MAGRVCDHDEQAQQWAHALEALRGASFAEYIRSCRWFGGKAQTLSGVQVLHALSLGRAGQLILIQVDYLDAPAETYLLPLRLDPEGSGGDPVVAKFESPSGGGVLVDALGDENFRAALWEMILGGKSLHCGSGEPVGSCSDVFKAQVEGIPKPISSRSLQVEQSNSAIIYGGRFFLKLYRKPELGVNPDAELLSHLSGNLHFVHVPRYCGAIAYRGRVLALLVEHVPNEGDAWKSALSELGRYFDRVLAQPKKGDPALIEKLVGHAYLERARQLGERTAQMHLALAADTENPDFAPEAFTESYQEGLCESMSAATRRMMQMLEQKLEALPANNRSEAVALLQREQEILRHQARLRGRPIRAARIRLHGDYHLGQVLDTGSDFVIIDFEGEPARPLSERRIKHSPLRDVASMLRSFDYAAHTAIAQRNGDFREWADVWVECVSREFTSAYLDTAKGASFLLENEQELSLLLEACLLEKAVYEVCYELNNRPDWVAIPLRGITRLLDRRQVS